MKEYQASTAALNQCYCIGRQVVNGARQPEWPCVMRDNYTGAAGELVKWPNNDGKITKI